MFWTYLYYYKKYFTFKIFCYYLHNIQFDLIYILYNIQKMIMNKDPDEWPKCEVLFSWYSYKYPIQKAIDYAKKYKPLLINDL